MIYDDAVADITQNGDGSLSTSGTFDIQWVDCATNTPIAGATGSNFVPTANGDYAVIACGPNWCPDTSACFTVDYLNLETQAWNNANIMVEPNPTNGLITITFPELLITIEDTNPMTFSFERENIEKVPGGNFQKVKETVTFTLDE